MAARRSSQSRSGARRAAPAPNYMPIIVGGVVVVGVLIVVLSMMSSKTEAPKPKPKTPAAKTEPEKPAAKSSLPEPAMQAKPGKPPTKAPPTLETATLTAADELYNKAKTLDLDARKAQAAGDQQKFNTLINDSWETLTKLDKHLEPYTNWLEEADMEGWEMPGIYRQLQRRFNQYDKLKGRVRKAKPNRQK
ncbi:MAG: hypothetical protein H6836_01285 [Planctomycetes bacterium]|nr:hypothetical protein [Planctomycetota bacterium]MCB9888177.1 hypothetical protein [Planctomycetota bacterium]